MTVVVVAWILALMAVFGLNYSRDALGEAAAVRMDLERQQLRAWAWSGVEVARVLIDETNPVERAALALPARSNPLADIGACGDGRFAIGRVATFAGFEEWRPGLEDEASRLPVAVADSFSLSLLPGMTPYGAEVLLAARDAAGDRRLPPFALLGLDESSLDAARRFLSRYGAAVNINTAGPEVLEALGMPESAVDKILDTRAGGDRIEGTDDDVRFENLEDDTPVLRSCGLNSEEAAMLALLAGTRRLVTESHYWNLASTGWGGGLDGICEIRAVLEIPQRGPSRVLEWTEHWLD